jgi:hypothetical protein
MNLHTLGLLVFIFSQVFSLSAPYSQDFST